LVKALQQLTDFQRITTTADDEGMFHTPHSADNEHPPLDAVPRTDTVNRSLDWRVSHENRFRTVKP
jgi:hypothetical protein